MNQRQMVEKNNYNLKSSFTLTAITSIIRERRINGKYNQDIFLQV